MCASVSRDQNFAAAEQVTCFLFFFFFWGRKRDETAADQSGERPWRSVRGLTQRRMSGHGWPTSAHTVLAPPLFICLGLTWRTAHRAIDHSGTCLDFDVARPHHHPSHPQAELTLYKEDTLPESASSLSFLSLSLSHTRSLFTLFCLSLSPRLSSLLVSHSPPFSPRN